MKNKWMNYVLGTVVGGIWIGVLVRIYFAFFATDAPMNVAIDKESDKKINMAIEEDNLSLLLDYDEPFALAVNLPKSNSIINEAEQIQSFIEPQTNNKPIEPITLPQTAQNQTANVPLKPLNNKKNMFKWETIKYKGMVQSGDKIGLIKLNGVTKYVHEKEKLDSNLYLIELNSEYIRVKQGDSIKSIPIGN